MKQEYLKELSSLSREQILVLNSSYEPINITSWKRAFILILKEKAKFVSKKVIRLVNYVKVSYSKLMIKAPTRQAIYARDDNRCQYCGSIKNLTLDHIVPKSKGGKNTWDNLVVACHSCNAKKGDKMLEQSGMRLFKRPSKPRTHLDITIFASKCEEWKEYCYSV